MPIHIDKPHKKENQSVAQSIAQEQTRNNPTVQLVDNRPNTVVKKLQEEVSNSRKGDTIQGVFSYGTNFENPTALHGGPAHGGGGIRDYFNRWNPSGLAGNLKSDAEYHILDNAAAFGLTKADINSPNYRIEISNGLHYDSLQNRTGPHFTIRIYNVASGAQVGGTHHMYVYLYNGYITGVTRIT